MRRRITATGWLKISSIMDVILIIMLAVYIWQGYALKSKMEMVRIQLEAVNYVLMDIIKK